MAYVTVAYSNRRKTPVNMYSVQLLETHNLSWDEASLQ